MELNLGIKSFMKPQKQAYPTCFVCGKFVRFPAKCDNCGNVVCNRHRPAFTNPWYCPKCQSLWQNWAQNNQEPMPADTTGQISLAEKLYSNKRIVEAELILDSIIEDFIQEKGSAD